MVVFVPECQSPERLEVRWWFHNKEGANVRKWRQIST
jgi:hypothetical protein